MSPTCQHLLSPTLVNWNKRFQKLFRTIENVRFTKEKKTRKTKVIIKHENSNPKKIQKNQKRFRANSDWIRKYHRIDYHRFFRALYRFSSASCSNLFGAIFQMIPGIISQSNSIIASSKQFKSDCKQFSHFFYLFNFSFNKLLSFEMNWNAYIVSGVQGPYRRCRTTWYQTTWYGPLGP